MYTRVFKKKVFVDQQSLILPLNCINNYYLKLDNHFR